MAPVILSMDVHCHVCAKNIQKAAMKLPGVDSVSFGTARGDRGHGGRGGAQGAAPPKTGKAVSNGVEGSSNPHPSPPLQPYGAPPPQAAGAGYYYPALGVYGGQYWAAAPFQPPVGFYTGKWPACPLPEGYYPWQGGEVYGGQQMWAPFQQDENPHSCCVQ